VSPRALSARTSPGTAAFQADLGARAVATGFERAVGFADGRGTLARLSGRGITRAAATASLPAAARPAIAELSSPHLTCPSSLP